MSKRLILVWAALLFSFVLPERANSAEIKIPALKGLFITEADLSIDGNKVILEVDKSAYLIVKVPHLSRLKIKYSTDSSFLLHYTTVIEPVYVIKPHLLFSKKINKQEGELILNLKDTINWDYNSYPYLIVEGTGKLVLEKISATVISDQSSVEKEKNRAFFWRSEQVRYTSMNFLTPAYWNYTTESFWPDVLAIGFFIITMPVIGVLILKGKDFKKTFVTFSIITVIIFNAHFLVRFLPIINVGFYLPSSEKIKKYYFREDFGNLIAKARETVTASDKVAFMGFGPDWFSKEALCFNIAPIPCVYYKPGSEKLAGLMDAYWLDSSDINVIVSYNSDFPLPYGFQKVKTQNKNSFIARKK